MKAGVKTHGRDKYYVTKWTFLVLDVQRYTVANHIDSIILNVS